MSNERLNRITEEMWGVPDLVVKILSEGTTKEDKEGKFQEYERAGVQEYWIVDPSNQVIEIHTLENGIYKKFGKWGIGCMRYNNNGTPAKYVKNGCHRIQ